MEWKFTVVGVNVVLKLSCLHQPCCLSAALNVSCLKKSSWSQSKFAVVVVVVVVIVVIVCALVCGRGLVGRICILCLCYIHIHITCIYVCIYRYIHTHTPHTHTPEGKSKREREGERESERERESGRRRQRHKTLQWNLSDPFHHRQRRQVWSAYFMHTCFERNAGWHLQAMSLQRRTKSSLR